MRLLPIPFLLAAFALPTHAVAPADAVPAVRIEQVPGCEEMPQGARIEGGVLHVAGKPDHAYVAWLEEHGIDVELAGADGGWVDSAPPREAREPLRLTTDAEGRARIGLRISMIEAGASLLLRPRCGNDDGGPGLVDRYATLRASKGEQVGAPDWRMLLLALRAFASAQAPGTVEWFHHQLGRDARRADLIDEAIGWHGLAIAAAEAAGEPRRAASATLARGQALLARVDAEAGSALQDAIQRAQAAGMEHAEMIGRHDLCLTLRVRGELDDAIECLGTIANRMARPTDRSTAYSNLAIALLMLGRYGDAVEVLERGAEAAAEAQDASDIASIKRQQAQLARWAGDFERALALLAEAAETLEGQALQFAHTQRLIADTYALAGERVRAMRYYQSALDGFDRMRAFNRSATVRNAMARNLYQLGDYEAAIATLLTARDQLRIRGSANERAATAVQLARSYIALDRREEARQEIRQILSSGIPLSASLAAEADLLQLRLEGPEALGDATAQLSAAMEHALAGDHLLLYLDLAEALVEVRAELGETAAARELAAASLALGERVVTRLRSPEIRHAVLQRLRPFALFELRRLGAGRLDAESARNALLPLERLRRLEQQPVRLSARQDDLLDNLERAIGEDELRVERPGGQRMQSMLALHAIDSEEATNRPSPVADEAMLLPTIAAGETMLQLVVDGSRLLIVRLDGAGWKVFHADAAESMAAMRALRDALATGHSEQSALQAQVTRLAAALGWQGLITQPPVRLAVLADSPLEAIPWELLPAGAGAIVGDHSEIVLLQSLRPLMPPPLRSVTALAATSDSDAASYLHLAAAESAAVLEAWPKLRTRHLPHADHQQLERLLGEPGALLHIASHGRADQGLLEESGLWLRSADGERAQFVSALRIRRMEIAASHVVLSACESGYSMAGASFGVGGVGGSLVDAGAGSVVATRWPVSDRAAHAFSVAYHQRLAAQPDAPATALREAQLALRGTPALRHPTHWAGWFLLLSGPVAPAAGDARRLEVDALR